MAKTIVKKTAPRTQVPAKTDGTSLRERMKRDAGRGVSTKAADNLVPLVQVLQPLSPQVLKKNQNYIEGASAGDFIVKSLNNAIFSGSDGIYFQPVAMYQDWIAWIPRERGGGFAGRYPYNNGVPPEGSRLKDRKDGSRRPPTYTLGEADIVDTRYIPGFMWQDGKATPLVIPFTSTGHAVAKSWMTRQGQLRTVDDEMPPAYGALYLLTTEGAKNNLGEWFKVSIGSAVPLLNEDGDASEEAAEIVGDVNAAYDMAEKLSTAFANQELQAHFVKRDDASEASEASDARI